MKSALVVAVALVGVVLAGTALAATREPRLEGVASRIAGQPVEVLCYERSEAGDPYGWYDAWGYVRLEDPTEHMAAEVCAGAVAIATDDPSVPDWQKAIGAVVLAHESYHLAKRYANRGDEAQTECRAIRHARYVMIFLGASEAWADRLMGWALALHWRLAARFPEYHLASCAVPNPY